MRTKSTLVLLLSVFLITGMTTIGVSAQTAEPNCVGYSAQIFENTVSDLNEENQKLLLNKVDQIIARNAAGKTAFYNAFSIVAEFAITDNQVASTGLQNVYVAKGELTLFAINNIDKSRYGSTISNLTGTGSAKELAIKNMIQTIKATDPTYAKFIKNSTGKIIDYYNNNMGVVIKKAETLIAQEKYEDAVKVLQSIPECVPAYMQSAEAIKGLADIVITKSCESALEMAQRYYELKQYEEAKEALLKIKPGSKCSEQAMELAKLLGAVEPIAAKTVVPATQTPTQAQPATPKHEQPAQQSNAIKVENGFKNVTFSLSSCVGNANDQSIELVVLIKHELINQKIYTNQSDIYLPDGEKITGSSPSESVPTGVVVRLVYKFKGILPSVKELPLFSLNMHRTSEKDNESQKVNFRNVVINWK